LPTRSTRALLLLTPALLASLAASLVKAQPSASAAPATSAAMSASATPAGSAAPTSSAAPASSAAASSAPDAGEAPELRPDVAELRTKAERVRALLGGKLALDIDAFELFDIDIGDDRAVAVEVERLRRVLEFVEQRDASDEDADAADGGVSDAGDAGTRDPVDGGGVDAGGVDAGTADAGVDPKLAELATMDPQLFDARLALDQARLAVYRLAKEERLELISAHKERQQASSEAKRQKELGEAERAKQEAAAEREKAERAAQLARSEAERAVAQERVRLLRIKEEQAALDAQLISEKQRLDAFLERLLGARLDADKLIDVPDGEAPDRKPPDTKLVDAGYDALALRADEARTELRSALDALSAPAKLPHVGADKLAALTVPVARDDVKALRQQLLDAERILEKRADEQAWARARQLDKAIEELDARRLTLRSMISSDKRKALSGFDQQGLAQAKNELGRLTLVFRYHFRVTRRFIAHAGDRRQATDSAIVATITALKWLLPIGLFLWWRRRSEAAIAEWYASARDRRRRTRGRAAPRSGLERALNVLKRVHNALEWLLLVWAVLALLPQPATELLEVQLLSTTLRWLFGGNLVVNLIDALFAESPSQRRSRLVTGHLRLQSLRLVGRTVVTFGLLLSMTSSLVGKGTIYDWVWIAVWISVVPIAAIVVRWWREAIFQRIEAQRKKSPLTRWIAGNQSGLTSIPAAFLGGGYLFALGVARFVRTYVGNFDWTKRLLAYWFRREVEKKQAEDKKATGQPRLAAKQFSQLGPDKKPEKFVPSVADGQIKDVISRIKEAGGAVYALVGERGAGKSTLLQRIDERTPDTVLIRCQPEGIQAFHDELSELMGLELKEGFGTIRDVLNKRTGDNAILVDDAQHLIRPVVDGLHDIDRLLAVARKSSVSCTWVFAFDAVPWQLFQRARETRPLFDDIIELKSWSEEGIVRLLEGRSRAADVHPDFSKLITDLPPDADPVERQDALERARAGYFRLLWDYSQGNPAVALHYWRQSLSDAKDGAHLVRLYEPPSTDDLERLPDSSVFVMRAVVQFGHPTIDDIVDATLLEPRQVEDALRYAAHRGYLEQSGERYHLRWSWFRTITRFLVRRHLLMAPRS
jgi:hypothetical protein